MPSVDVKIARIEEAIIGLKEDRVIDRAEARIARADILSEIKDMRSAINGMSQNVASASNRIAHLNLESIDSRVEKYEVRVSHLENKTQNLPMIETEVMFWRRVLGSGFPAIWKICAVILSSGFLGSAITKWWTS